MPTTPFNAEHLNQDQIDDHLIGDLAPQPAAHLAGCADCAALVAAAARHIADFQAVTQAWSERRSATMPVNVPTPALQPQHMALRIAAGATAAVILMMGVRTMPLSGRRIEQQTASTTSQPIPQRPVLTEIAGASPAEMSLPQEPMRHEHAPALISHDNQMLQDIDTALAAPSESAASLGLEPVNSEERQLPVTMSLQD